MKKLAAAMLAAVALAPAQTRVFIAGTPTNLLTNWSTIITVPDSLFPNSFYAVIPMPEMATFPHSMFGKATTP